jgi:hypothetical protein
MPRRKFAVPSVPPINLLMHKSTKNIMNFGMQSIGQAPVDADPPVKRSSKLKPIVELTHRQFLNNLVPFSNVISSLQPAWQLEM